MAEYCTFAKGNASAFARLTDLMLSRVAAPRSSRATRSVARSERRKPRASERRYVGSCNELGSREYDAASASLTMDMQGYVSNELTHFLGRSLPDDEERYELLLKVLRSGTLLDPRYQSERDTPIFFFDVPRQDGSGRRQNYYPEPYFEVRENGPVAANEFVAPEMVCFCDIPVKDLTIHTSKYSRFGLAFSKAFLVAKGASPVQYVAQNAATPLRLIGRGGEVHPDFFARDEEHGLLSAGQDRAEFLEKLKLRTFELIARYSAGVQDRFASYQRGKDDPSEARAELLAMVEFMMGTFCYVHGLTKVFDPTLADNDPNNFYMEREWRVIGTVTFTAGQVLRVLIPRGFGDRFRRDQPDYAGEVTEL